VPEYARHSRPSSRFGKTIAVRSLPRIPKNPSTRSRQPRGGHAAARALRREDAAPVTAITETDPGTDTEHKDANTSRQPKNLEGYAKLFLKK
jgi:hypothetical protein